MKRILFTIFSLAEQALRGRDSPHQDSHPSNDGRQPRRGHHAQGKATHAYDKGWHPDEKQHKRAERVYWEKSIRRNSGVLFLTIFVAIGAGASAWFAWSAADSARDAANEARRQADASERANIDDARPVLWLATRNVMGQEKDKLGLHLDGEHVVWNLVFFNYGKGIATETNTEYCITISLDAETERDCPKRTGHGVPVPPSSDFLVSAVFSRARLRADQFERLLRQDGSVVVTARVTYSDTYGRPYESRTCSANLATGAIMYCAGNSIK